MCTGYDDFNDAKEKDFIDLIRECAGYNPSFSNPSKRKGRRKAGMNRALDSFSAVMRTLEKNGYGNGDAAKILQVAELFKNMIFVASGLTKPYRNSED